MMSATAMLATSYSRADTPMDADGDTINSTVVRLIARSLSLGPACSPRWSGWMPTDVASAASAQRIED